MPLIIQETMGALSAVTKTLPIGTNLGVLHVLWMLVNGSLLNSRGALFPGLLSNGLSVSAVRRAWAAFRGGAWEIDALLASWQAYVNEQGKWVQHCYEGYYPKAVDLTAFWRPQLKKCPSKYYHPQAQKALPAIVLGVVGWVGHIGRQRLALPQRFVRVEVSDPSKTRLHRKVLEQVAQELAEDEVVVLDAGFKIQELEQAGLERYVLRLAKNFTARRHVLPPYKGRGRKPIYGERVRPLSRHYKAKCHLATPPDETVSWQQDDRDFRAEIWRDLVLNNRPVADDNPTFTVFAIYDSRFAEPWLLATPLALQPASVYGLYRDRWPIEQLPLAAKQMVGGHRQFVSAPESCQRLPELALLAGSMLSYLAATLPPRPTGFWDRQPRPTPGRLRRALQGLPFPDSYPLDPRFRKKASPTDHLPKGILGHRRRKAAA